MTPEQIRTITNHFCRMTKKCIKSPEELRNVSIVLERIDEGWDLKTIRGKFNRRKYVTVIDLPEDLYSESLDDAIIDLAGIISRRLAGSARALNSTAKYDKETMSRNGRRGAEARWHKS